MMRRLCALAGAAGMIGSAGALVAAARPNAPVTALDRLAPGKWEVHEIGRRAPPRSMCIADPAQLLRWRHPHQACERVTTTATANAATVYYTCPGTGHGQTVLTVETPALVRIQTQGIANGEPFDLDLEARRAGKC